MARTLLLAALLVPFTGCATELHVITPINHLSVDGEVPAVAATANPEEGAWLARSVYETKGVFVKVKTLKAIEILFCPTKRGDFSACRQGIGWSSSKNPLAED